MERCVHTVAGLGGVCVGTYTVRCGGIGPAFVFCKAARLRLHPTDCSPVFPTGAPNCPPPPPRVALQIWVWGEPWGDFSMQINRAPRRIDTSGECRRCSSAAVRPGGGGGGGPWCPPAVLCAVPPAVLSPRGVNSLCCHFPSNRLTISPAGDFVDISCGAFHNLALNAAG